MLSRLGKKLKALVSRETVQTVPEVPAAATSTQSSFAMSDAQHVSSNSLSEAKAGTIGAEPRGDPEPATVLTLASPSPTLDQVTKLEAAPEAIDANDIDSADATFDDDLTVMKLALANDEPHQGIPSKQQATDTSNSRSNQPDRSASQNSPEEEYLLDLAIRSSASTRLINVLRDTESELPAKTVAAYIRAPHTAREAFRQLENFGEKTATELNDLVIGFSRKVDQDQQTAADSIVDVIREADCSVRLLNAITAHSHRLPVITASEYMKAPEYARQAFLKLPNLGRKSVEELDLIVRSFVPNYTDVYVGAKISGAENYHQSAIQAAEAFLSGLRYPDELFEWSPQVRLANLLKIELEKHPGTFVDFLRKFDETTARLRSRKNCGQKSIKELDEIVSRLIEARLSICGSRSEIAPDFRRLLRGEFVSHASLARIIELGSIKHEDIKASESASIEELTIVEIIERCISTLNDRQQDILHRRYGINREHIETLEQVASSYDLTRERIRQIETKAKQKFETKRTRKVLISVLEQERSLEKLFKNRKIVSNEQISAVSKLLTAQERLAIDLAYGDMNSFLDTESVRTDAGWVQEQDLLLLSHEAEDLSGSLRQRIVSAIRDQQLPIRLSRIATSLPDYPPSEIKIELEERLGATLQGDIVVTAPKLPSSVRCVLILKEAGHAMHCEEIRARMYELFGKDESIGQIGNTLAGLEEALIVERGTYNLYKNLGLTHDEIAEIRERTLIHLGSVGGYVSAKVLFSDLFQGETDRFGIMFGPYMLLGITQDDGLAREKWRDFLLVLETTGGIHGYKRAQNF